MSRVFKPGEVNGGKQQQPPRVGSPALSPLRRSSSSGQLVAPPTALKPAVVPNTPPVTPSVTATAVPPSTSAPPPIAPRPPVAVEPDDYSDIDPERAEAIAKAARQRIKTLEYEVADLKRTLGDALHHSKQLEAEKHDLQKLVDELSGVSSSNNVTVGKSSGKPGSAPMSQRTTSSGAKDGGKKIVEEEDVDVSERSRGTILQMRLKRSETRRTCFIEVVKNKTSEMMSRITASKNVLKALKEEVLSQMDRTVAIVHRGQSEWDTLWSRFSHQPIPDGDPNLSAHFTANSIVAALQQTKVITPAPMMPNNLAEKLTLLLNAADGAMESLTQQWQGVYAPQTLRGKLGKFSKKQPADAVAEEASGFPILFRPRRYMDNVVNLTNYTLIFKKMKSAVDFTSKVMKYRREAYFPQLREKGVNALADQVAILNSKTDKFFEALRLLRTAVVVRQKNLSTAMRIFGSAEDRAIPEVKVEATKMYQEYLVNCQRHSKLIFKFVRQTIEFYASPVIQSVSHLPQPTCVGECTSCTLPVSCDDCRTVASVVDVGQRIYVERRRTTLGNFYHARVQHVKELCHMIDACMAMLHKHRLVPFNPTAPPATAAGQAHAAHAAAIQAHGQGAPEVGSMSVTDVALKKPFAKSSDFYFTRLRMSEKLRQQQAMAIVQREEPTAYGFVGTTGGGGDATGGGSRSDVNAMMTSADSMVSPPGNEIITGSAMPLALVEQKAAQDRITELLSHIEASNETLAKYYFIPQLRNPHPPPSTRAIAASSLAVDDPKRFDLQWKQRLTEEEEEAQRQRREEVIADKLAAMPPYTSRPQAKGRSGHSKSVDNTANENLPSAQPHNPYGYREGATKQHVQRQQAVRSHQQSLQ